MTSQNHRVRLYLPQISYPLGCKERCKKMEPKVSHILNNLNGYVGKPPRDDEFLTPQNPAPCCPSWVPQVVVRQPF